MAKNAFYAQSGGVTAVINASAYGVIKAAQKADFIDNIYCGLNGVNGALDEKLIDISKESPAAIEALRHTPGGAFGSARKKLQDMEKNEAEFTRILEVMAAHEIQYFFYNGGNDSMDTVDKLNRFARKSGSNLQVIGVPKTIDNDLPITDNCPGFGSVAKYNTVSMMEASLDTRAMCHDSTKVFIMETMGRHAGWIAASTGLASRTDEDGPQIILLPEVPFEQEKFLKAVEDTIRRLGYITITVSEGVQTADGKFLSESGERDAFGHAQLGGAGIYIQELVKKELNQKVHSAVLDYCQRSGRHLASGTDVEQAIACGEKAVEIAGAGTTGHMVTIVRESETPYKWSLGSTDAGNIANKEKMIPPEFIREDGLHITDSFKAYCQPLIVGEDYPPYTAGMPDYMVLKKELVPTRLEPFKKA